MPPGTFAELTRRQKQLEILRTILAGIAQTLALFGDLAKQRPLTQDEGAEATNAAIRHDRVSKGIEETQERIAFLQGAARG